MKKIFSLAIAVALFSATAIAQTPADSIAIVKAKWQKTKLEKEDTKHCSPQKAF